MNKTKGEDLKISNLRCYYNYAINFCCEKKCVYSNSEKLA